MQGPTSYRISRDSVAVHALDPEDAPITASLRIMSRSGKGARLGIEARGQFDALMERVQPRQDVTFAADSIGGVPGLWVNPASPRADEAILHLHGGWFNFGSAIAFRHLVGHIAARAGARAFIPDYRLAPEHPFPAAVEDALASFRGLAKQRLRRIAVTGDSAGGNLALGLASSMTDGKELGIASLVGVAALSPVTDLTLSGGSYQSRAHADPLFTRAQVEEWVKAYLGDAEPHHPSASPLHARLSGMAPVRIHVGDDEVLLDDSRRYFERAVAAGVDARLDVWMGMPHGFSGSVGRLKAATRVLDAVGSFLLKRLQAGADP